MKGFELERTKNLERLKLYRKTNKGQGLFQQNKVENMKKRMHVYVCLFLQTKEKIPILIAVTRSPQALRSKPILLAVTPLPSPLTTPPVTRTYFMLFLVQCLCCC